MLDEDKVAKLSLVDAITHHCSVKLRQSQTNSSDLMNSHSITENSAKDGSLEQSNKDDGGWGPRVGRDGLLDVCALFWLV